MTETTTRPAFRAPWSYGAAAYFEADTFDAAREGFKRKRKGLMFHMPAQADDVRDVECAYCHGPLGEPARAASKDHGNNTRSEQSAATRVDKWSTFYYVPADKSIRGGVHYQCSWSNLLGAISAIRSF